MIHNLDPLAYAIGWFVIIVIAVWVLLVIAALGIRFFLHGTSRRARSDATIPRLRSVPNGTAGGNPEIPRAKGPASTDVNGLGHLPSPKGPALSPYNYEHTATFLREYGA